MASEEEYPVLKLLPIAQKFFAMTEIRRHYGLTKSQIIILVALYYRGEVNMTQIAEIISSSKEQATRAVAGMVEDGLAERAECAENRTKVYIRLTNTGRTYVKKCRREFYAGMNEKLDAALTAEEKKRLFDSLETVTEILGKV